MIGAVASISILLALATLHAYWASGGNFGKGAAIPERNGRPIFRPSAAITYLVAGCLALSALVIAMRAGLVPSAAFGSIPQLATWALVAVFAMRAVGDFRYVGFFKRVRGTDFSRLDTAFYSPLCCLLALLIADAAQM
jgi:Protein of unknown function (DUF3995)